MLTSGEPYIIVDPNNSYDLNDAHRRGYVIVSLFYNDKIEHTHTIEKTPIPSYGSSSGNYNSYSNNDYVEKQIEGSIVVRHPKLLMKLGPVAEVIYGKDS